MGDETLYTYELKKTMLPGFLTKGIRIRESWISRCKRYLEGGEPNLAHLITFINKGLIDRLREGFKDKALDEPLSIAQKWLMLHLILKDGVPEYLRDEVKDEDAPELLIAEPINDGFVKSAAKTAMKPVTSLFKDTDGDGIPDEEDDDDDGDGIPDDQE